jgi:son of sevenless
MLSRGCVRMLVVRMGTKLISHFAAVHLKELHRVLQNNPITVEVDQEHLINFQRYVKFMDQVKELFRYKAPELELYRHDGRLEYLEGQLQSLEASKKTEDEVVARSLFLERRENVDLKRRKPTLQALGFDVK